MEEFYPIGSLEYLQVLAVLAFARAMDFLSTWIATPNLALEANPIAKRLGWRVGLAINFVLCLAFATWPIPAIVIATTSVLVAARNFQYAWLMRSLGEQDYRQWMTGHLTQIARGLYLFCLGAQTMLVALVGIALMYFSRSYIPFAIGLGIVTYSLAIALYTLLALRQTRSPSH